MWDSEWMEIVSWGSMLAGLKEVVMCRISVEWAVKGFEGER